MEINNSVKETALRQKAAQVYISKSQQELKKSIAEFMGITDDSLELYAEEIGDVELLSKATNSVSDYSRLPNEEFEVKVKSMIEILDIHLPNMAEFGFSSDELENVKSDFNVFQRCEEGSKSSYPS